MKNEECWYKDTCNTECKDNCIRFHEMKYLMDHSGLPKNKQAPINLSLPKDHIDMDKYIALTNIKRDILNFVEKGNNLLIISKNNGNGKTSWSIKLLQNYFNNVWAGNCFRPRGYFVRVSKLLNDLKDFNSENDYIKDLEKVDLVVWDDIVLSEYSKYDYTKLFDLIDGRLFEGKANIFTSNVVDFKQWNETVGEKLASRIYNSSTIIELNGEDCRGINL